MKNKSSFMGCINQNKLSCREVSLSPSFRSVSVRNMGERNIPTAAPIFRICLCGEHRNDEARRYATTSEAGGFTLIELLVVVLIIGILAAVAVPQYQKAVVRSRYATLKNLTDSIARAQELHRLTNGAYASDFEELDIDMPGGKLASSSSAQYVYNWGNCSLSGSNYDLVFCLNYKSNMEYHIQLKNLDSPNAHVGKRCVVRGSLDLSDLRNQICKRETGATGYDVSLAVNGNAHWWYE